MQAAGLEASSGAYHMSLSLLPSLSRPVLPRGIVVKVRYVLSKCLMLLPSPAQLPSLSMSPCSLLLFGSAKI